MSSLGPPCAMKYWQFYERPFSRLETASMQSSAGSLLAMMRVSRLVRACSTIRLVSEFRKEKLNDKYVHALTVYLIMSVTPCYCLA